MHFLFVVVLFLTSSLCPSPSPSPPTTHAGIPVQKHHRIRQISSITIHIPNSYQIAAPSKITLPSTRIPLAFNVQHAFASIPYPTASSSSRKVNIDMIQCASFCICFDWLQSCSITTIVYRLCRIEYNRIQSKEINHSTPFYPA